MAYDVLPMVILIGSVLGILLIIGRKFPHLKALDVASIPAERELQLRKQLLLSRLQRHGQVLLHALTRWLSPALQAMARWLRGLYQRVQELESESRPAKPAAMPPISAREELNDRLTAARRLHAEGKHREAEEQLIQLIGVQPAALDAYELLGEVNLALREHAKAREVYTFLAKRLRQRQAAGPGQIGRLASCYRNLATAHLELGRNAQALQYARKAVQLEPNNPRLLDFLLKVSIVVKDKSLAEATWGALRQADPQNAKLDELRQQVDGLP